MNADRRDRRTPGLRLLALLRIIKADAADLVPPWQPARRLKVPRPWPEDDLATWRATERNLANLSDEIDKARKYVAERVRVMTCDVCGADLTPDQVADGRTACDRRHRRTRRANRSACMHACNGQKGTGTDGDAG